MRRRRRRGRQTPRQRQPCAWRLRALFHTEPASLPAPRNSWWEPLSSCKVAFVLEFEFSCSFLLNRAQVKLTANSDSLELNETLADNMVQVVASVRYEPDLFLTSDSTLNRYEVHPVGTFPNGMRPEFRTTVKVQNLGCYAVGNLSLSMELPATAFGGTTFLSITRVWADNVTCSVQNVSESVQRAPGDVVPVHPEDLSHIEKVNCTNAGCQRVKCEVSNLERNSEISIHVLRTIHNEFFRKAKFKTVKIVSRFVLTTEEENNLLILPKDAHRRETVLEVIQSKVVPLSLWILIGSIIGGLLLLALIIICLWKLGFFAHKKPGEKEDEEE
nr:PREDICTED: integrin alpha-10 [Anolis carolinensis]|eukprot:XP_008123167.1 PREDICTED: integrin alpha-10 [Anolis carolinensis]